MQKKWRRGRMKAFSKLIMLSHGDRIIDLGGTLEIWSYLDVPVNVTLLNLPEVINSWPKESYAGFRIIQDDACSVTMLADNSFDLVFSNSVIEHLPINKRLDFAKTVKRLAPNWWIQTPSIKFPIEAHCNLPYWWVYPDWLKNWFIASWQKKNNVFLANQMQTTTALSKEHFIELFGECNLFTETFLGFDKSYSAYRTSRL
jgi:Methyltransferase domain